jgi:hypothetical protein
VKIESLIEVFVEMSLTRFGMEFLWWRYCAVIWREERGRWELELEWNWSWNLSEVFVGEGKMEEGT